MAAKIIRPIQPTKPITQLLITHFIQNQELLRPDKMSNS